MDSPVIPVGRVNCGTALPVAVTVNARFAPQPPNRNPVVPGRITPSESAIVLHVVESIGVVTGIDGNVCVKIVTRAAAVPIVATKTAAIMTSLFETMFIQLMLLRNEFEMTRQNLLMGSLSPRQN